MRSFDLNESAGHILPMSHEDSSPVYYIDLNASLNPFNA